MRGFSLVELLVTVSVFLVFFIAVTHVTVSSSKYVRHAVHKERAVQLAEEAIEASRNIRDADFANLSDGTFGLATSSNQFSLSGLPDTTGIFTRSIVVSPIGPYQKQIDVTVSWADQTSDSNAVTLTSYLTDWRKMTPQAGITVTKTVINHGGSKVAADFAPYTVGGGAVTLGVATTTVPGTYTVAEAVDADYVRTFGGDCDSSGSITVASGDAKVCSLVNEQRYVPVVSDPTSSLVTQTTATLGANVTSLGLPASISARGTCWGTLPAPATNCVAEGSTTTGVFTHARTGFLPGTLYYYRGYATNAKGTDYSADGTFTTQYPISTVTFVGSFSNAGISIAIPAHQSGDLLVIFAYRDGAGLAPSLPVGWTNIGNTGAGLNASRLAYRVATATNTLSGTWTNATGLVVHVYRGQHPTTPIGATNDTGGTGTTITYPALTMVQTNGSSWVAGFAGHRRTNTALQTSPLGMINRTNFVNATNEVSGHDTNGGVTSWNAVTVNVGGTSDNWRARTLEIRSQ